MLPPDTRSRRDDLVRAQGLPSESTVTIRRHHIWRRRLAPVVVGLLAIVVVWFLPAPDPVQGFEIGPIAAARGVVLRVDEPSFDQSDPFAEPEGNVLVRLTDGPRAGAELRAFVALPSTYVSSEDFAPGDEIIVSFTEQPDGPAFVSVAERWRAPAIVLLIGVFALTVVAVTGWQGVRALIALLLTIVVTLRLLIPAILQGVAPVPVALLFAGAITTFTIILSEGLSRTSLAAVLGAIDGLAVTAVIAALFSAAASFTGAPAGDLAFYELEPGRTLDLSGLLLAAIIIGAAGVLDDMTVTQAATVEELARRTTLRGRALGSSALRLGRSHIAATTNTLFMAYVGASLPALVFLTLAVEPAVLTLNREVLALEVVRTLAGSLGIVLAMPITTAIATLLVGTGRVPAMPVSERKQDELAVDRQMP
jgi:uncharacterized membrane protein